MAYKGIMTLQLRRDQYPERGRYIDSRLTPQDATDQAIVEVLIRYQQEHRSRSGTLSASKKPVTHAVGSKRASFS